MFSIIEIDIVFYILDEFFFLYLPFFIKFKIPLLQFYFIFLKFCICDSFYVFVICI